MRAFIAWITVALLIPHLAHAAVVEVEVTIKSVDAKARGISVTYETTLGQKSIDLDVSRKAEINVNGASGTLESLQPGQKAKVSFEKEVQVVTKIVAAGSGKGVQGKRPQLVECSELNDMGQNGNPWLSEDGLTIYWDRSVDGKTSIWTARRENPQSMFTDKKALFAGRCPTLSADGLEMVFMGSRADGQEGRSLYAASRTTATGAFRRPSEIAELAGFSALGPCLSVDGLTLYLTYRTSNPEGSPVVYCTRPNRSSPWISPKTFTEVSVDCPSLTPDGKHLLGHGKMAKDRPIDRGNLLILSRSNRNDAFGNVSRIEFDGFPVLAGWSPRYAPSSRELFFARSSIKDGRREPGRASIWIIKDFILPGTDE